MQPLTRLYQTGFILLELIIALVLSLLIFSLLLSVFLASERSDHLQAALNQIEDSARTAMDIFTADVSLSGYLGCPRLTADFPLTNYPPYSISITNKLLGRDHDITVSHASRAHAILRKPMQTNQVLYTSVEARFHPGDVLLISDCAKAEMFKVAEIAYSSDMQIITASSPLKNTFTGYAEISHVEINQYFVARTSRTHTDGSFIYSLFRVDINQRKIELVEDISRLNITYDVAFNDKIQTLHADSITDWSRVVGVAMDFTVAVPPLTKIWHLYLPLN